MNRFTEVAVGKCPTCGDQYLSLPGRTGEEGRRIICPICLLNAYDDLVARRGTVILSPEEIERCSE